MSAIPSYSVLCALTSDNAPIAQMQFIYSEHRLRSGQECFRGIFLNQWNSQPVRERVNAPEAHDSGCAGAVLYRQPT